MQEFSSITASSYDAESLAPLLTEKSAEGWVVVSIVAAGTNIVAYLSREGSDAASPGGADVSVDASPVAAAAVAVTETAVVGERRASSRESLDPAASEVTDAGSEPTAGTDATTADAAAVVDTPTLPGGDTPYVPTDSSISTEPATTPAEATDDAANLAAAAAATATAEPAGWVAAPDNDVTELEAQVGADAAVDSGDQTVAATDDAAVVATADGAASESSVPAGWYADPSGRYELRYWDGGAWTEHVSRAGQQFTDPPVA